MRHLPTSACATVQAQGPAAAPQLYCQQQPQQVVVQQPQVVVYGVTPAAGDSVVQQQQAPGPPVAGYNTLHLGEQTLTWGQGSMRDPLRVVCGLPAPTGGACVSAAGPAPCGWWVLPGGTIAAAAATTPALPAAGTAATGWVSATGRPALAAAAAAVWEQPVHSAAVHQWGQGQWLMA
jgi:hypothetical protein